MTWPAKFGEWTTMSEGAPMVGEVVILYVTGSEQRTSGRYSGWSFPFNEIGGGYPFKESEIIAWMPMPDAPSALSSPAPAPSAPERGA